MKYFLFLLLIIITGFCHAQKQYNVWCFGLHAMVDFNTNPPTGNGSSAIIQHEGCANICDANGQLLFYSDGVKVWNRNHQQMPNGFGLLGNWGATQSALIIPLPGSTTIYYIFTAPGNQPDPLCYSIVDMSLDGGLGDITNKNVIIHAWPMTEKLTATLKSNGTDYWIITRETQNQRILAYSFTAAGLDLVPVVSQTPSLPAAGNNEGYERVSTDGSKLVLVQNDNPHIVQLFDFNNSTGIVSNPLDLTYPNNSSNYPYGAEFSPDNSKLYVLTDQSCALMQYDLLAGSATAIQNSVVQVFIGPYPQYHGGALMRGPDNRIYVCNYDQHYISVIDQPNLSGTACNYISQAIQLAGICRMGFPNNINYPVCPIALSVSSNVSICANQSYQLPSGTIVNTPGTYIDTVRSIHNCDSVITTVNLSIFQVSHVNTSAAICSGYTYQLPSGTVVNAAGIYQDTIRSTGNCDSVITTVDLSVFPVSHINNSAQTCQGQTYLLPWGTTVSNAGIYYDTTRSVNSCDSIITSITLLVNIASTTNLTDSIVEGEPYVLPWGQTVNSPGIYQTVLVNSEGCDSVITMTLEKKVQLSGCLIMNNAFTPNGDGVNDYWVLSRYHCFRKMDLDVYNRYGSLVYHSDDYDNDWQGTYKNKNLPDGTYYFTIRVFSFDGREYFFKGNVSILR